MFKFKFFKVFLCANFLFATLMPNVLPIINYSQLLGYLKNPGLVINFLRNNSKISGPLLFLGGVICLAKGLKKQAALNPALDKCGYTKTFSFIDSPEDQVKLSLLSLKLPLNIYDQFENRKQEKLADFSQQLGEDLIFRHTYVNIHFFTVIAEFFVARDFALAYSDDPLIQRFIFKLFFNYLKDQACNRINQSKNLQEYYKFFFAEQEKCFLRDLFLTKINEKGLNFITKVLLDNVSTLISSIKIVDKADPSFFDRYVVKKYSKFSCKYWNNGYGIVNVGDRVIEGIASKVGVKDSFVLGHELEHLNGNVDSIIKILNELTTFKNSNDRYLRRLFNAYIEEKRADILSAVRGFNFVNDGIIFFEPYSKNILARDADHPVDAERYSYLKNLKLEMEEEARSHRILPLEEFNRELVEKRKLEQDELVEKRIECERLKFDFARQLDVGLKQIVLE